MDVRMPDGTIIRGVPEGVTKADLQAKLDRAGGGATKPAEPTYDPTEGMGWGEKALANVGAGMHSAWTGAKQLVGQGPSDEDLQEKRRIDKQLAEKTTGGSLLQTVGEIAPTIPLGLGAGMGARALGGIAAEVAASPTLSGMIGGGAQGALAPVTSDESRLSNVGWGAAGGGAAPSVLKLAGAAARGAGGVGQRIAAAVPEAVPMIGPAGARAAEALGEKRTAALLKRELPEGIPADVYTPTRPGLQGASAAVTTQDPALAGLERASRTAAGEHWMPYDEAAQTARWNTLESGLQNQADVDAALAGANRVGADVPYLKVDPGKFNKEMGDFYSDIQTAKQTAQYHGNPVVRNAVDYVEDTMRNAGQVTPELLHTMRRTVTKGLTGAPGAGEAGVRAAASEPFIVGLAKKMDDVLEKSSGGEWNKWKAAYSGEMAKAESAKADVNIRNKFIDQATGTLRKPGVGGEADVPQVTGAALKQAMTSAGSMKRGPRKGQDILRGQSKSALNEVLADLEAQGILQRSKAASTGGSGSDTASNLTQAALMEMLLPSGFGVGRYVQAESNRKAQQAMQRQLAELLQDPDKLRRFVAAQARQRMLRDVSGTAGGAAGAGAGALLTGQ